MSDQFDINALLSQAMDMQSQLMEAQAQAAEAEVVGRAGGGAVEITVTGSMQFLDVSISPDAVDPETWAAYARTVAPSPRPGRYAVETRRAAGACPFAGRARVSA